MFYSFNLVNFGAALKDIRKKNGLSQFNIKELTGINEDTIRKLENGIVVPRYETIEILSKAYKCDLLKILQAYRNDEHFYKYYTRLDRLIANNEFYLLDSLIADFNEYQSNYYLTSLLIDAAELKQFELYLKAIRAYCSRTQQDWNKTEQLLIQALRTTMTDFDYINFYKLKYNLFEIRILLLYGLVLERLGKLQESTSILLFVKDYIVDSHDQDREVQSLMLKIYTNLSYNYHKSDNNELALKYAEEGIDYAVTRLNMSFLYLLYGRKGIAELNLKVSNFKDSLVKSIHLLEINKQFELSAYYKKIYKNKYHIRL